MNQKIRRGIPEGIGLSPIIISCFHSSHAFGLAFPDPPDPWVLDNRLILAGASSFNEVLTQLDVGLCPTKQRFLSGIPKQEAGFAC